MDELEINWEQERPSQIQLVGLWTKMKFERIENWSTATDVLSEKIIETHVNGGIQLHRYKVSRNDHFHWFASRNRLDEIDFVKKALRHKDLSDYRNNLEIKLKPEVQVKKSWTDMYDLPGRLARILGQGGAYKKINQKEARKVVTNFISSEFDNRFEEVLLFDFAIKNSEWFYGIAWDYSTMLFDKRNYTVTIIDITDTD
ncbi:hypothetical protein [Sediminitomix flava]|uniref:Uncharacterized protein n=1 Tax=Sediminitomix flava TaxID=379075 RepID=A0A315YVG5_SEDFL|nr:hypothetical protein [Sediminitomix flava]PWJ33123.1 hypothetical protein BC781_1159 [Sediminitomix flava]